MGESQHAGHLQRNINGVDDAAPQGILNIVVDIGDVVGQPDHLALQRGGGLPLGVAEDAVAHLPGQVQPLSVFFQTLHHPQGLLIVSKAAGHQLVKGPLTGMSERGVPQIVSQGDGLGQVLVEGKRPGNGSGDSGDLQGVGHSGAVVVALGLEKDLGLMLQPPEGLGVHDPIHIPLKAGADGALLLRTGPAPG